MHNMIASNDVIGAYTTPVMAAVTVLFVALMVFAGKWTLKAMFQVVTLCFSFWFLMSLPRISRLVALRWGRASPRRSE